MTNFDIAVGDHNQFDERRKKNTSTEIVIIDERLFK